MPVAKVQLADGRIAKFDVPDGTTPEQVTAFAASQFTTGQPAASPASGGAGLTAGDPADLEAYQHGSNEPALIARLEAATQRGLHPVAPNGPAAPPQQNSQPRSFTGELVRQGGLTARYAMEGVAGTAGILADPIGVTIGRVTGQNYQPLSQYVGDALTHAGMPQPETRTERVVGGASRALAASAGMVGAGASLARVAGAPGMAGQFLAANPAVQATSATSGGLSSSAVHEAGFGRGAEFAAGLIGGLAPGVVPAGAAGIVRTAIRGGESGRQTVANNLRIFEGAGTSPTVGQATEGRMQRATESGLAKTPGAAGVIAGKAEQQAEDLSAHLEQTAGLLVPKSSATRAGMAIESGIKDDFLPRFRSRSAELYSELDKYLPAATPVEVHQTKATLNALSKPIKGAEATSALLSNPKVAQIREAIEADAADGHIPYQAIKELRSQVGGLLTDTSLVSDIPKSQLKRLYASLTSDMEGAAHASGSQRAIQALDRANNFYRAGMSRIDQLDSVVQRSGGPEAIFKAATSGTKEGATTIRAVMQSLPDDAQKHVAAAVVRRMGTAKPGAQDDAGGVFSTETFLTNWASMSNEAKATLFNRFGPEFAGNMDRIASVAANLRKGSKVYANPSGTASATLLGGSIGAGGLALLQGNVLVPGGIAATAGLVHASAKLLTNPEFVRWLAQSTRVPIGGLTAQVPILQRIAAHTGSPEVAQFASALAQQQRPDH